VAKADFEKAKAMFPSIGFGESEWLAFFDTPAGFQAMGAILGDIYDVVKAEEDKAKGIRTMGRRPARKGVSLDEVYATVFPPQYTNEPFPVALKTLMAGRSQRQFCMKIPCHQTTLSRMLSGTLEPDLIMMERVADAAKVPPSYFAEWRAHYIGRLITNVFLQRPHMSITAVKSLKTGKNQMSV
jgi:hypothetical protein